MLIERLALIGVGLIGGSLAAALREHGAVRQVVGCARRSETLQAAQYLGLIDEGQTDPIAAVAGADMVLIAVPMGAYRELFARLKDHWPAQAVVTDAGSTKGSALSDARAVLGAPPANFVPGHPIAGTERSGPAAARADLFRHRRVILTPAPETDPAAVAAVTRMWEQVGASVTAMEARHHDEVLALTSHLPHVVAYQLIDTLAALDVKREVFAYAAGGLKDLTRIASSNPKMWRDIMAANADAIVDALSAYIDNLGQVRDALRAGDMDTVGAGFERAKQARDRWIYTAEPD